MSDHVKHRKFLLLLCTSLGLWTRTAAGDVTPRGSYATSITIETPAFRSIGPQLGLEYNSHGGNGPIGVGWSLRGLSEIRRTSATDGAPQNTPSDKYRLDGIELIPCAGAAVGSRVANSPSCKYALPAPLVAYTSWIESFRRIAFEPSSTGNGRWLVWNKDGTKTTYVAARDTSQWNISKVEDVIGNRVRFTYVNLGIGTSADYIDEITYNQTRVKFFWEQRSDVIAFAARAGEAYIGRRLKSIDVQVEKQRLRAYALSYRMSPGTSRSILARVDQFGTNAQVDAGGTVTGPTLPATTMVYDDQAAAADWRTANSPPVTVPGPASTALPNRYRADNQTIEVGISNTFMAGDFDGDGRTDALALTVIEDPAVAHTYGTTVTPQTATLVTNVRLASQLWVSGSMPFSAPAHWGDIGSPPFDGRDKLVKAWVADVSGDGLDDLILLGWTFQSSQAPYAGLDLRLNAAFSRGDGTFTLARPQFTPTPWSTAVVWGSKVAYPEDVPICLPGDFNGDGRADFACTYQDSVSKHFVGVAYSNSVGGFTTDTPIQIADDPGTEVTDDPATTLIEKGFVPYETRRMAAGDVNNDGQSDLILVDLNAADVSACAQLGEPTDDSGNGTPIRATCTIKYDLLTMVSRGDGFDTERVTTPWLREDFVASVPGSLAAADLNGDARADAMFLTGAVRAERLQTLRNIRTAIRPAGAAHQFTDVTLASALTTTTIYYAMGDANGDGRTDLMIAAPITPGGGTNCSSASFNRVVVSTVPSSRTGAFTLPALWDDCSVSTEVTDSWAEWTPFGEIQMMQVGDTNGDGSSDFLFPVIRPVPATPPRHAVWTVYDRVAQPAANAERRWIAADLNGDGKTDFVHIGLEGAGSDSWATTMIAGATGGYQTARFQLGSYFSLFQGPFQNQSLRTWRITDVNADGKADIVHVQCAFPFLARTCALEIQSFLSRGDGTFSREPVSQIGAVQTGDAASLASIRLGDVNRDGRTDLIQTLVLTNPRTTLKSFGVRTLLSDGSGWSQPAIMPVPGAPAGPVFMASLSNVLAWQVGDFDGDGRVDLLHLVSGTADIRLTLVSRGQTRWQARSVTVPHPVVIGGWPAYKGRSNVLRWRATDVNGDGLSDLVRLIGNGTTFVVQSLEALDGVLWTNNVEPVSLPAGSVAESTFGARDWHSVDVDGDGLSDVVYVSPAASNALSATILYASGTGFGRVEPRTIAHMAPDFEPRPTQQLGDFGGTGNAALLYVDQDAVSANAVVIRSLRLGRVSDLLTRHTRSGATTAIEYVAAGRFIDPNAGSQCGLPLGAILQVVQRTISDDGRKASSDTITYGYACATWSYRHRALLGWDDMAASRAKAVNRPESVVRTRHRLTDECLTQLQAQSTYNTGGVFIGARTILTPASSGNEPPYRCLLGNRTRITHGSSGNYATAVNLSTAFSYDEFGNVQASVEDSTTGQVRATLRSFKYATQPYIVNVLATDDLRDGPDSSAPLRRARIFCYDGDTSFTCSSPPVKGLQTGVIDIWEQGRRLTTMQHDTAGNIAAVMDANNHGTAYFFDPVQRLFPVAVVNAASQTTVNMVWDRTLGKPTTITSINGDNVTFEYDEFGRVTRITSTANGTVTRRYELWGNPEEQYVLETQEDGSPDGMWARHYIDGLGREYRLERKSESPRQFIVQLFDFSDTSQSPYRVSRLARSRGPILRTRTYTTYTYDEAGGLTLITHPDGAVTRTTVEASGNRLLTTTIDENNFQTQTYQDAFNRLVETRAFDGSQIISTKYEYDAADQTRKVIDPNGNFATYEWDLLGRHSKMTDPDLGVRTYTYDLVGNLKTVTDARNRTTTYNYDVLNRPIEKILPFGGRMTWTYDQTTSTNGRGRLTSFNDPTSTGCGTDPSAVFNYDRAGRPTSVSRCIQGQRANFGFQYDALGRVREVTYPDMEVVTYEYDAVGALSRMPGIFEVLERDTDGRPTRMTYGNGVTRQLTYDPRREWLLTQIDTLGSTPVFDSTYTYEPNGLVKSASSTSNQTNIIPQYDTVKRIRGVTGSHPQTWTYDAAGNMMSNSEIGNYTYSVGPTTCTPPGGMPGQCPQPHGAQSAGIFSLKYDANGLLSSATNTQTMAMRSIDWTADMQPFVVVDFDGTQTTYGYNALGERAVETRGNETITYFGPLARRSSLTGFTNVYLAGERVVAAKTGGVRRWMHFDRTGSLRAVSDANGTVVSRMNFGVFGEPRPLTPSLPGIPPQFFGASVDPGTSLQYMGARFYDPVLNRFISPDSIIPNTSDTQAANRYAFNYNNPLSYTDPSGHQPIDVTSPYYGAPGATASFDFSVHGFSNFGLVIPGPGQPYSPPPPVRTPDGTTGASGGSGLGVTTTNYGASNTDWLNPDLAFKRYALRQYERTNLLCGVCHAYRPSMDLHLLSDEERLTQGMALVVMVAVAGGVAGGVALEAAFASEAVMTGSIWLYSRAPTFFNVLLAIGNALNGTPQRSTTSLVPDSPGGMLGQLRLALGKVPVTERESALRSMLRQIRDFNTTKTWNFREVPHPDGLMFQGTAANPILKDFPTLMLRPDGSLWFGNSAIFFNKVTEQYRYDWTNTPVILVR